MKRIFKLNQTVCSHSTWITAVTMALTLSACSTTIPRNDSVPPEVRLTLTGPGIGRKEMSNPPRDNWTGPGGIQYFNMQPGAQYNFILSVSDQGGVQRAHLRFPDDFTVSDVSPADVVESTSGISTSLTLSGERSDPRTGLVMTGTIVATRRNLSFEFQVEGDDFGGSSGRPNQTFMSVNVFSGD